MHEVVKVLAESYGDFNIIHPFREGNGRAQRLFFEHMLLHRGYSLDWRTVDRPAWVEACIAAVHCDYRPLEQIFDHALGRL